MKEDISNIINFEYNILYEKQKEIETKFYENDLSDNNTKQNKDNDDNENEYFQYTNNNDNNKVNRYSSFNNTQICSMNLQIKSQNIDIEYTGEYERNTVDYRKVYQISSHPQIEYRGSKKGNNGLNIIHCDKKHERETSSSQSNESRNIDDKNNMHIHNDISNSNNINIICEHNNKLDKKIDIDKLVDEINKTKKQNNKRKKKKKKKKNKSNSVNNCINDNPNTNNNAYEINEYTNDAVNNFKHTLNSSSILSLSINKIKPTFSKDWLINLEQHNKIYISY